MRNYTLKEIILVSVVVIVSFCSGYKMADRYVNTVCGGCKKAIEQMNERVMVWNRLIDSGNVIFICTDNKELNLPSYKREIRVLEAR